MYISDDIRDFGEDTANEDFYYKEIGVDGSRDECVFNHGDLESLILQYEDIQRIESSLKSKKEELKSKIISAMGKNTTYDTHNGVCAMIQKKVSFKYTDEKALIACLEEIGKGEFVKKVVNTTPFNNVLKTYDYQNEPYAPYIEKTTTTALVVK